MLSWNTISAFPSSLVLDLFIITRYLPCAVATLENIYDKYGFDCLDRVLRLCVGTWEGVPQSFSASMLNGVARMLDLGLGLPDVGLVSKHFYCIAVCKKADNSFFVRPASSFPI